MRTLSSVQVTLLVGTVDINRQNGILLVWLGGWGGKRWIVGQEGNVGYLIGVCSILPPPTNYKLGTGIFLLFFLACLSFLFGLIVGTVLNAKVKTH